MDTNKLNLDAYYYSFEATGIDAVDTILSAVANAGAGYHNTSDWNEQAEDGTSPLSEMQAAAEKSAEDIRALIAENERLRKLPTCWSEVLEQSEANDQLLDQVLELSADAERYRYLRAKGLSLEGHDFISFDEIADYRIDVAMGKEGK